MSASLIPSIPFTRVQADTNGNIALNLNSRATMFISSAVIAAPATITIGGGLNNYSSLIWRFTISGLHALTFPVNIKTSDPTFTANVWQPLNIGEYEMVANYDGTNWNVKTLKGPYSSNIHVSEFGALPGANCSTNRTAIQAGIDYASTNNKILLFDADTYNICLDNNGRGLNIPSNTIMMPVESGQTTLNFIPATNFITSNFTGGTIAADQVRAITIDNNPAPVENITIRNFIFTTPSVKWYDANNFLQMVPICLYFNNTNIEADYLNPIIPSGNNYNFINCEISNFQRGSITVKGRKITNVLFSDTNFLNISNEDLQYPTESRFIYTNVIVDGLSTVTTEYDFAVADGIAYTLIIYNGTNILYTIPYVTSVNNPNIGSINNNPLTAGLMQWTINATVLAQATSLSVACVRRSTDATGAPNINGVCCDAANIDGLTIENGNFNGCCDQFSHYIYLTRRSDNILINNNNFTGRGVKKTNIGGGIHIRGAAYTNATITNNTFTNVKGHNINLSSVTNAIVTDNIMNWDYDQNALGSIIDFTYGALMTLDYSNNEINPTNTFLPASISIAYSPLTSSGIKIKNNIFSANIENVAPLSMDVEFWNNTVVGSAYTTTAYSLIVMVHTLLTDELNISFKENSFTFGVPSLAQPIIAGFTGFTWDNNTIVPSINVLRLGDALKLNDVTIQNCTINSVRFNCAGFLVVNNVSLVNNYISDAVYTDMVINQEVEYSTITDLGTQPRSVVAGAINIIKTESVNISIAAPGNLEYFFVRSFDNVNLPYQITLTNVSAHTITVIDYLNSVAILKNFDNGGVNFNWLAGTPLTLQLDKPNARWIKI